MLVLGTARGQAGSWWGGGDWKTWLGKETGWFGWLVARGQAGSAGRFWIFNLGQDILGTYSFLKVFRIVVITSNHLFFKSRIVEQLKFSFLLFSIQDRIGFVF